MEENEAARKGNEEEIEEERSEASAVFARERYLSSAICSLLHFSALVDAAFPTRRRRYGQLHLFLFLVLLLPSSAGRRRPQRPTVDVSCSARIKRAGVGP